MSLRLKTILGIAIIEIALLAVLAFTSIAHLKSSNEDLFLQRAVIAKQLFATMVSDSVISFDLATLDSLITNALKNREIIYIRVRRADGRVIAKGGQPKALNSKFSPTDSLDAARTIGRFDVSHPLVVAGSRFGHVEIGMSLANTETAISSAKKWLLGISLIEVALVALFSFVLGTFLTRRIGVLQQAAQSVANGEFGIQVPEVGTDELSSFASDFNRMSLALRNHEQELRDSEQRLKATVSSALDGVIVADADGTVLEFNAQSSECFGYSRSYAVGRNLADLIIPERMRSMHAAGMKRYLETGEAKIVGQRIEIEALHAEGHEFPVELAVGSAISGGKRIFVAYVRDISERRQSEQRLLEAREKAEAADEAKSRFLAVMSHEMRTPLNGITGVLQILRDTPLGDDQRTLIDTADRSGEVLLDLINDVLDISKMESGKLHLNTRNFAPRDLLQRLTDVTNVEIEAKGNSLHLHVDKDVPALLHGDDKRLTQVLLNLTSNANKFTTNGRISIAMNLKSVEDQLATLSVSVTDTGIGIPDDKIGELFSEFTALEDSYNRRQGGTGLGLSICRNFLELMGGQIQATSILGSGSCFRFEVSLPLADSAEIEPNDECSKAAVSVPGARVLLAEDNATNAMVAKTILAKAGFEVKHVENGEQAFEAAREGGFDIILMDISMPGMDGMEATALIRELPASAARVPIVAMTAHSLSSEHQKFMAAGMNDCVTKPIRKDLLIQAINQNIAAASVTESQDVVCNDLSLSADEQLFDESGIGQLAHDVGPEAMPDLMKKFAVDIKTGANAVYDAFASRDLSAVRAAAHSIKGCAVTIGATKLSAAAAQIEDCCAQEDWQAIEDGIKSFQPLETATVEYARGYASRIACNRSRTLVAAE